jgi:hypothetical protein
MSDSEREYNEYDMTECEECNCAYRVDDGLPDCGWCDHHRSEQQSCPICSYRVDEFGQILCYPCFYIGFSGEDKEITYCNDCECFIVEYDCPRGHEDNRLHSIERDADKLELIAKKKYPLMYN